MKLLLLRRPAYGLALVVLSLTAGCSLSELGDPDFGTEGGYFRIIGDEVGQLVRDRNYVSVELRGQYPPEYAQALFAEHDLEILAQVVPKPHYLLRCRRQPAESYYTTYGDTLEATLGNRSDVQFALPVFLNEYNFRVMLTDRLMLRFNDDVSEDTKAMLLDSLKLADVLNELPFEWGGGRHLLQLSKASPHSALDLANQYDLKPYVQSATVDWALQLTFVEARK